MKTKKRTPSMMIENLEGRQLMTAVPTELSQLAAQYPVHSGVTNLYLNFDGGNIDDDKGGGNMSPYQADPGVDRDQMIRDIVYRTSEIFSPFNVRVRVMHGNGNFSNSNGDSTIFIGDDPANTNGGYNVTHAYTSFDSADYPSDSRGYTHAPNSDAYDLGFVDPIAYYPSPNALRSDSAQHIAQAIAHESGHTFGLAHDLSAPQTDVMSYDAANSAFLNTTLNITDLNYDGTSTGHEEREWPKVYADPFHRTVQKITKENTFAYLNNALGKRPLQIDSYAHSVADSFAVSADYYATTGNPTVVGLGSHPSYMLGGAGDYDVYTARVTTDSRVAPTPTRISLAMGNLPFDPQIMLYSGNGVDLLASTHGSALVYQFKSGTDYQLVVSSYLGDTVGNYTLNLAPNVLANPGTPLPTAPVNPILPPVSNLQFLTGDSAKAAMASLFA